MWNKVIFNLLGSLLGIRGVDEWTFILEVIQSVWEMWAWIYSSNLFLMTFRTDQVGRRGGGERTVKLFTTMSWLSFFSPLCSHFLSLYLPAFSHYLPLFSLTQSHTPNYPSPQNTKQERVCWPITQGNFVSFLRGFHQSPTTLLRRVGLIVSDIPLYST